MPFLHGSLRLNLLDECIWLLPWLRNAICFEIGFVLNLSFRSKGCSLTNHCSRIIVWIFCEQWFWTSTNKNSKTFKEHSNTLKFVSTWILSIREDFLSNYSRVRFVLTPWSWIHLCGRFISDLDGSSNGYGPRWSTSRKEKDIPKIETIKIKIIRFKLIKSLAFFLSLFKIVSLLINMDKNLY